MYGMRAVWQVLLFPPSQSFHLYPYVTDHPMDNFAMV